jgi:hypothetical protein
VLSPSILFIHFSFPNIQKKSYCQGPGLLQESEEKPKAGRNAKFDQGLSPNSVAIAGPHASCLERAGSEMTLRADAGVRQVARVPGMDRLKSEKINKTSTK